MLHKARAYLGFDGCHGNNVTGVQHRSIFGETEQDETDSSLLICGPQGLLLQTQRQILLLLPEWPFTVAITFILALQLSRNNKKGKKLQQLGQILNIVQSSVISAPLKREEQCRTTKPTMLTSKEQNHRIASSVKPMLKYHNCFKGIHVENNR